MSTYEKYPTTLIEGGVLKKGWDALLSEIRSKQKNKSIAIECYTGVYYHEVISSFKKLPHALFVDTRDLFKDEETILTMTIPFMTDDSPLNIWSTICCDLF